MPRFLQRYILALFLLPLFAYGQISGGSSFNPASVTITGGSINGTSIGLTATASIKATSLTATVGVISTLTATTATAATSTISTRLNIGTSGTSFFPVSTSVWEQRNGAIAQGFRVYNTYTDASNNEPAVFDFGNVTGNWLTIGTQNNGTGTARNMTFMTGGTSRWNIDTTGSFYPNFNNTQAIGTASLRVSNVWANVFMTSAPVTYTAATYTVAVTDSHVIANASATSTITLPAVASFIGRNITIKNIAAQLVNSAASNVVPIAGGAAAAAILPATAGKFVRLVSDGTNWVTMEGN